jgi:hypothetical protein
MFAELVLDIGVVVATGEADLVIADDREAAMGFPVEARQRGIGSEGDSSPDEGQCSVRKTHAHG